MKSLYLLPLLMLMAGCASRCPRGIVIVPQNITPVPVATKSGPTPKWIEPIINLDRMEINMAPPSGWICPKGYEAKWPNHLKHVLYETADDDPPVCEGAK